MFFSNFFLDITSIKTAEHINNEQKNEKKSTIDINYLKRLPEDDYILGPGDQIFIRISRNTPELDSLVTIDGEGTILLPKINRIFIKGLTTFELNELLNKSFEEFVLYPNVESQVIRHRPIRVLLKGEVNRPGLFQLDGSVFTQNLNPESIINNAGKNQRKQGETLNNALKRLNSQQGKELGVPVSKNEYFFPSVFDAIRKAGGITEFSDLSQVEVMRIETLSKGGGLKKTKLDFASAFTKGDMSQNIRVLDGDIITINKLKNPDLNNYSKALQANINPYFINVIVSGRVKNPGNIVLPKSSSLTEAVLVVGGPQVMKGKLNFIRYNNDGTIDSRKIRYNPRSKRGSYKNPILKNNDLIFIDESFLSSTTQVIKEVSAPIAGVFSMYGLVKALKD